MNIIKYSRFIIYVGTFLFILEHFFFRFYSLKLFGVLIIFILNIQFVFNHFQQLNKKIIPKLSCLVVGVLYLNFIIMQGNTGYGSILILLSILSIFVSLDIVQIKYKDIKNISYIFSICLLLYFFIPKHEFNPNTISYTYAVLYIIATIIVPNNLKGYIGVLTIFLIVYLAASEAGSRTVMIALLAYVVSRAIPVKIFKNKLFLILIMIALTVGSLLYVHLYIHLYMNDVDVDIFTSYSDKRFFSGRQLIWIEVLNLLSEHPFVGIGSSVDLVSFESFNIHNSMLNLCAVYGYIIGAIVMFIYIKIVVDLSNYSEFHIIKNSIAGYLFFFIVGLSETCLFFESFGCSIPLLIAYSYRNNLQIIKSKNCY